MFRKSFQEPKLTYDLVMHTYVDRDILHNWDPFTCGIL